MCKGKPAHVLNENEYHYISGMISTLFAALYLPVFLPRRFVILFLYLSKSRISALHLTIQSPA